MTLSAVKIFHASQLADTVVVSNSFWNSLSSKLPALLLAEALASLAFVAIASILIAQGKFLLDIASPDNSVGASKKKRLMTEHVTIDISKLLLCIAIDTLGSANEAIPLAGEIVDAIYAPVAALILRRLFQESNVVLILEFVEEILPFTDVLPLATVCWVVETFFGGGDIARVLRIGDFGKNEQLKLLKMQQFDDEIPRDSSKDSSIEDAVVVKPISSYEKSLDEK